MTALLPILFFAGTIFALASMAATGRRYAGAVLALRVPSVPPPRPRSRRSIASRARVRTPRRAALRGKRTRQVRIGV